MNGIELSRRYYEAYGREMLESFPDLLPHIAVGVGGSGSEWIGFDDETSHDHDFGPGFTVYLPEEEIVTRRQEFLLERAYEKLPKEFLGYTRERMSPVGGNRFGVRRASDFFESVLGTPSGELDPSDFLRLPEQYLIEATNGAIFYDGSGAFTAKKKALSVMPEDVRLKKIAGTLVTIGQAGSYNFFRCVRHGESGAAQLALSEFASSALHLAFLLNHCYMPFYKWCFRAASGLKHFSEQETVEELITDLTYLLSHENAGECLERKEALVFKIERESETAVQTSLSREGYRLEPDERTVGAMNPYSLGQSAFSSGYPGKTGRTDLGRTAEQVNNLIRDPGIRNLHILSGI